MSQIRPIAICHFRHNDKTLVSEGHDSAKAETFYRPLGGGIEFGEHSTETTHRELYGGNCGKGQGSGLFRHT